MPRTLTSSLCLLCMREVRVRTNPDAVVELSGYVDPDGLTKETPADRVCIPGDGAQSGQAAEYAEARDPLDATLRRLKLGRERLFVVRGNHDSHRAPVSQPALRWQSLTCPF